MLRHEAVVGRGGVGPRDLDLYGDGGTGGRALSGSFLSGPGDHLVRTGSTVRVRAEAAIPRIFRVRLGQVEDRLNEGISLYLILEM